MTKLRALFVWAFVAMATALVPGVGDAGTLARQWMLDDAVRRADLIAIGTVANIAFRMSDGGDGYLEAPHTFVTYRVEEVLRGVFKGETLTLRLLGGYSPANGRIMVVPHGALFQPGDRDVLFVAGNGTSTCPLVGCGLGRFRVVDGRVFSNWGLAVRVGPRKQLQFGPDSLPDRMISMQVPAASEARLDQLRRRLVDDTSITEDERRGLRSRLQAMAAPQSIGIARITPDRIVPPEEPPADVGAFTKAIRDIAAEYQAPTEQIETLSPDEPFVVLAPAARKPAPFGRPARLVAPTLEQRLLERNGGNPVLRDVE